MLNTLRQSIALIAREFADFERFFAPENRSVRQLVFYAESEIYFRYYEDYLDHLTKDYGHCIAYISSDPNDEIFTTANERISPFYFKHLLPTVLAKLDSRVLVMTAPDLGFRWLRRAPAPVHHVYAFHGISSIHQAYRAHAFDNYDSLLCIAPYQISEIRQSEQVYKTKSKELVLTGYPLLERIYRNHQKYKADHPGQRARPLCVIAPTWTPLQSDSSLMETCISALIEGLKTSNYEVWLRPHPEFCKRKPQLVAKIESLIRKTDNIKLQSKLSSMQILHEADVLITDHSSIAIDYALGTERPVLWIDTPTRIDNPEFDLIGTEPVETQYRSQMGMRLAPAQVADASQAIAQLLCNQSQFAKSVPALREKLVANWLQSSQIGAKYISELLR